MTLCLHPTGSARSPGFMGYALYDSPGNRPLPPPESLMFLLENQEIVGQTSLHPKFPRTITEVFVEGELSDVETATFLTDVEGLMQPEG